MEVLVEIETGKIKGEMSKRALNLIFEWMDLHKQELMRDWEADFAPEFLLELGKKQTQRSA